MIEKRTVYSRVEVMPDGDLQIRLEKQIVENGVVIAREYHRTVLEPGDDLGAQMARVNTHLEQMGFPAATTEVIDRLQRIAVVEQTPDVVERYYERKLGLKA